MGIGVQQKKAATLERKKKRSNDNNSSRVPVPVPLPLQLEDENSEYARVADHVKMSSQLMGSLKRKSPTFAPPPPPLGAVSTPPPINGQLREEEGEEGEFKAYDQPHKRTPLSPKDRGYDHLAKTNYDHLAPIEYPPSDTEPTETYATIEDNRKLLQKQEAAPSCTYATIEDKKKVLHQQETVPSCTYATIEDKKKVLHQQKTAPSCTYATIEGNRKMLQQQEAAPLCTYATINESRKMPKVPVPRRGNHLAYKSAAVPRRQASADNPQQNDEGNQLYSVVNKPRRQRSAEDVLQNVPRVVTSANPDHPPMKPMRRYTPEAASEDLYTLPDRSKNQREATHSHIEEPKNDFSSNSLPDRRRKAEAPDFNSLPNRSKRTVNPPPPVAPKPKIDRAKRSPTPNGKVLA